MYNRLRKEETRFIDWSELDCDKEISRCFG